jgi:inorganic pyrophosphatase
MLGKTVTVVIDRPMGTYHPKHKDIFYPVNYGYIPEIIAGDGEEQDAYVLGVEEPLQEFTGVVTAIIHRYDDVEEKWVVAPEGVTFSKEEIAEQVKFQEQYFRSEIRTKE